MKKIKIILALSLILSFILSSTVFAQSLDSDTSIQLVAVSPEDVPEDVIPAEYNSLEEAIQFIEQNVKYNHEINKEPLFLENNISVFAGNSGVGKSTLLNSIFGKELTKAGLISDKNKKGKNTTTNIALYKIKENEYIADTPGFSTFDISEIESDKLAEYFKEFKQYIKDCEYIGCRHIKEENCGIKNALQKGEISESRYQNFIKIYENLKDKEEHKW